MNDLISEFFYDGISRIIPGLVVIFLFAHRLLEKALTTLHDSSIILYVFIFLAAWLIGVTVEMIPVLFLLLLKGLSPHCTWAKGLLHWLLPSDPAAFSQSIQRINEFQKEKIAGLEIKQRWWWYAHRQIYKSFAEKIMFRSLFLIFLVTCFPKFYPAPLCSIHWHWYYGCAFCLIFLGAWSWFFCPMPEKDGRECASDSQPKATKQLQTDSRPIQGG
jgi:hypothetical protein